MTDVHVPFGEDRAETATLLLDAAESSKDHEQAVVRVDHFTDSFVVPEEIAKAAGVDTFDPDEEFNKAVEEAKKSADDPNALNVNATEIEGEEFADPGPSNDDVDAEPARKTATKKTAAKKTAAKKS